MNAAVVTDTVSPVVENELVSKRLVIEAWKFPTQERLTTDDGIHLDPLDRWNLLVHSFNALTHPKNLLNYNEFRRLRKDHPSVNDDDIVSLSFRVTMHSSQSVVLNRVSMSFTPPATEPKKKCRLHACSRVFHFNCFLVLVSNQKVCRYRIQWNRPLLSSASFQSHGVCPRTFKYDAVIASIRFSFKLTSAFGVLNFNF